MKKRKPSRVEQAVYNMLIENTGVHICDSGGHDGRHWQQNQGKTIQDFINAPAVEFDMTTYKQVDSGWKYVRVESTEEIEYTISVFHYLTSGALELDGLCDAFNALPIDDWDFDAVFGVSRQSGEWLSKLGAEFGASFNTFNYESALSQVLQGTYVTIANRVYVLLQIHGGCDVRGGYTDAVMFTLPEGHMPGEEVDGAVVKSDKRDNTTIIDCGKHFTPEPVLISNEYNGHTLTDDAGHEVKIGPEDRVELFLRCYALGVYEGISDGING